MSYDIVRGINVNERKGEVWIKAASNNVYPRLFEWFEAKSLSEKLREQGRAEVDKDILLLFWQGELQGGNSLYERTVIYWRKKLPYSWRNTGLAEGDDKGGGDKAVYTYDEVKESLYRAYLSYRNREKGRYVVQFKYGFVYKYSSRHIWLAHRPESARKFNSMEDATVYGIKASIPEPDVVAI